jgi:hypothetical protein
MLVCSGCLFGRLTVNFTEAGTNDLTVVLDQ